LRGRCGQDQGRLPLLLEQPGRDAGAVAFAYRGHREAHPGPPKTKVDGEIGKMELEAAKYVIARFELTGQEFQQAWDWLYGQWFPESGYQPDEKPCFEMYPEEPKNGKFVVDICVPVKPL
ncbi:MAG: GyrI-like domain-containing protein, partial [Bacteroidales bacterium]